jgi:O-antigen ligase
LTVVLQLILLCLFIFAAIAYGAVHYWAYSIVFGVTFLLCAIVFLHSGVSLLRKSTLQDHCRPAPAWSLRDPFLFFLAAFMLYVLFQLTPLSNGTLKGLSPYTGSLYGQAHALTTLTGTDPGSQLPGYLSLDRDKTVKSLLAFAAYLGFGFLLSRTIRTSRDVKRCALVLIIFAAGLSLYGLLSLLNAAPKLAGWKNPLLQGARVSATLVNPDHFALFLVMGISLTFGYLASHLMKMPPTVGRTRRQRWVSLVNAEGSYVPKAFLLLFLIGVMIVVLFYTLSRGAVIGLAVSLLFCLVVLFLKTRRSIFLLLMVLPVAFIVYYAQVVGVEPLLKRLEETRREMLELDDNIRVQSYRVGLELWQRFPWFGSGLGSFEVVFPMAASDVYEGFYVPYLHNDWLQLAVETGWLGSALFLAAVVTLFVRIFHRWWQVEDRWGFGFGLAAMSAMLGSGVHAFVDFGLRIPINSLFLVLLVTLALATLDGGFGRRKGCHSPSPGLSHRRRGTEKQMGPLDQRSGAEKQAGLIDRGRGSETGPLPGRGGFRRSAAVSAMLLAAALCLWSSVLVGAYGLAQHYSPSEIDTMGKRDYELSTAKLQKALSLNPLNGEYWMNLALAAEPPDAADRASDAAPALSGQAAVDPGAIPGWEGLGPTREPLQDWLLARALARSPATGEYWLAWSDHLWKGLQGDEKGKETISRGVEREGRLLERTVRAFRMALELRPNNKAVQQRASEFFQWEKQKGLPDS